MWEASGVLRSHVVRRGEQASRPGARGAVLVIWRDPYLLQSQALASAAVLRRPGAFPCPLAAVWYTAGPSSAISSLAIPSCGSISISLGLCQAKVASLLFSFYKQQHKISLVLFFVVGKTGKMMALQ